MLDPTLLEFKCTGKCRHLQVFPIKAISQGIFSTAFGSHLHCLGLRSRTYLKATVRAPNRSHAFTGGGGAPPSSQTRSMDGGSCQEMAALTETPEFL